MAIPSDSSTTVRPPGVPSAALSSDFVTQVTESQRRLYGFIRTLVYEADVIDEVLQETNLALWEQADRFEPGSDFMAWACRIAWFKVLDARRKKQRQRLRFADTLIETLAAEAIEDIEDQERQQAALMECLTSLPDKYRAVLEMHYYKQLTFEQIGRLVDRKANAVAQMLFRVRKMLRDCVSKRLLPTSS